ncbi:MAG: hypothetical protein Q9222_002437 [Ikaeria aurantiellina]
MASLESQRQQNIKRNQEHLQKLGIYRKSEVDYVPSVKPAIKKRKLFDLRPSRASARIAATAPRYTEADEEVKRGKTRNKAEPASKRKATSPTAAFQHQVPEKDAKSMHDGWVAWTPTAAPPTRDEDSTFHFDSHPDFNPNKSPEEMLREGCFGGSYFRPLYSRRLGMTIVDDYRELPSEWLSGLDVNKFLVCPDYNPDVNKFKVSCGQSIEEWEAAGWINHEYDVRGWFQWYCRFFMGRRCDDDERQVGRWKRCVGQTGRWRRMLIKKYVAMGIREVFDDGEDEDQPDISPVMHQTCFHWALEIRQNILDQYWNTGT